MFKPLSLLLCAMAIVISSGTPLDAQELYGVEAVSTQAEQQAEARIQAALSQRVDIEFLQTPLAEVVRFLNEHGVPAQLDTRALDDNGIATDTPIQFQQAGLQLRSALRLILSPLELTWTTRSEVLLITTEDEAESLLKTRIYNVRNLLPAQTLRLADGSRTTGRDFDWLIHVTTSTIAPETWNEVGGPGSIEGIEIHDVPMLLISQTDLVHEQIGLLLVNLHRVAGRPLPTGVPQGPRELSVSTIPRTHLGPARPKARRASLPGQRLSIPAPLWSHPVDYE